MHVRMKKFAIFQENYMVILMTADNLRCKCFASLACFFFFFFFLEGGGGYLT